MNEGFIPSQLNQRDTGRFKGYLEGVTVARNLPVSEMSPGRKVAVVFFDEHNPKEVVLIAVYS